MGAPCRCDLRPSDVGAIGEVVHWRHGAVFSLYFAAKEAHPANVRQSGVRARWNCDTRRSVMTRMARPSNATPSQRSWVDPELIEGMRNNRFKQLLPFAKKFCPG